MLTTPTKAPAVWTTIWPGLPSLWKGQFVGLSVAVIFSQLLIIAILSTLVWPDLLPTGAKAVVCFSVALFWMAFAVPQIGSQMRRDSDLRENGDLKPLFRTAQTEYLQGNWFQAESLLNQLLKSHPEDGDARLLLATLFRRIGRTEDAAGQLELLEQFSVDQKWYWEVKEEKRLLAANRGAVSESAIVAA